MRNPFLPAHPFITPSINRVRITALPGLMLPDEITGKFGYELLSASRLVDRVRHHAAVLQLDSNQADLLPAFDDCFTSAAFPVRRLAKEIATEYGRFLAYLLLTLKRGDPISRATRPEWEDRHWDWWGAINSIWLGGGLISGHLGQIAAAKAQAMMQEAGFPQFTVCISPYGGNLSLAGAARLVPNRMKSALVFDFGHTQIKRAVAQLEAGHLVDLRPFSPLPAPCEPYTYHGWLPEKSGRVMRGMVTAVAQTWNSAQNHGQTLDPAFVICLACYLVDGHPIPAHLETGCYARLQVLTQNLTQFMTEQISVALGQPIQVELVHDATAAALAYTGCRETAVITIGTSLGIGFPPVKMDKDQ